MSEMPHRFKTGETVRDSAPTVLVGCHPCRVCGIAEVVEVNRLDYQRWQDGALIQDALRSLPLDKRELLISGTHSGCWDLLFPVDDPED